MCIDQADAILRCYCLSALIKQTPNLVCVVGVIVCVCIDQANTNLLVCCWCYYLCALIKQASSLACVVGVIVCVCIDQANINLVCVVGVIVCVCIDQPNTILVCVVGDNCLCALITADSKSCVVLFVCIIIRLRTHSMFV